MTGRKLDVDASIQTINQKLLQGQHEIPLEVQFSQPEIGDNVTADQLGIHELVGVQATYFYGSSAARIQNIQTAAGALPWAAGAAWGGFLHGRHPGRCQPG